MDCQKELETSNNSEFEKKFVEEVYNDIGEHFSHTRYKPWPLVEGFLQSLPKGSCIADIGCGNGKYMGVNKGCFTLGLDISSTLVKICKEKGFQAVLSNGLHLPFRTNAFDVSISVAVIHHFSTPKRRLKAIAEMLRITKIGGKVLVYVWAFEQKNKDGTPKYDAQDVFVPWHLQKRFDKKKPQQNEEEEEVVHKRYYHLFKEGELKDLVSELSYCSKIEREEFEHENWCVILEKTKDIESFEV